MSTYVVMFHARSRPSDEGKEVGGGGGGGIIQSLRKGRAVGPTPESATDVQSPSGGVPRIEATTSKKRGVLTRPLPGEIGPTTCAWQCSPAFA